MTTISSSILPWKKAKTKRFNSVKPPKSRRLSLPSPTTEEDIANAKNALYGSTTSLPVFPLDDGDGGELIESYLNVKDSSEDLWKQVEDPKLSRSLSEDIQTSDIDVTPRNSPRDDSSKSSFSSPDISLSSSPDKIIPGILLKSSTGKKSQADDEKTQRERTSSGASSINDSGAYTNGKTGHSPVVNDSKIVKRTNGHHMEHHDDELPVSGQNGVIILNNVGVENANEYDRLHGRNPRHYNQLSVLLQELDTLINSLPESRQIGTPFSCSNFVSAQLDHRGGIIRLSEPDVCLCVPPGALPPNQPQTIYMYIVNPKTPALSDLGDEDHWLTPIVHCGPPGVKFRSHVALSLPCSVADESSWDFTVSRGVQPEYKTWESLEERADSVVLVKGGRITVLVDHFTPYGAKGKPNSGETIPSKWMEAGVFVHPPCGEIGEQEVQFHVRIWNVADRQVSREIIRVCAVYLHVAHEMFQITNVHVFRNGVWNCVY